MNFPVRAPDEDPPKQRVPIWRFLGTLAVLDLVVMGSISVVSVARLFVRWLTFSTGLASSVAWSLVAFACILVSFLLWILIKRRRRLSRVRLKSR